MPASPGRLALSPASNEPPRTWIRVNSMRAVARILAAWAIALTAGGLPLIFLGDETAVLSDHSYRADPHLAPDNRWSHRRGFEPKRWKAAVNGEGAEGQIYVGLLRLLELRRSLDLPNTVATRAISHRGPGDDRLPSGPDHGFGQPGPPAGGDRFARSARSTSSEGNRGSRTISHPPSSGSSPRTAPAARRASGDGARCTSEPSMNTQDRRWIELGPHACRPALWIGQG